MNQQEQLFPEEPEATEDQPMTKAKILEKYGIDLAGQETNFRGRVWTEELKAQIIAIADKAIAGETDFNQEQFLNDLNIKSALLYSWRNQAKGKPRRNVGGKVGRPRKTKPEDQDTSNVEVDSGDSAAEDIAASTPHSGAPPSPVRSMAGRIAKSKLKGKTKHSDTDVHFETTTIRQAIQLMSLMDVDIQARVSITISVE